ncbi:MAG: hypothetical protein ACSHXD_19855, partial [Marinosulfonomonas sp.]
FVENIQKKRPNFRNVHGAAIGKTGSFPSFAALITDDRFRTACHSLQYARTDTLRDIADLRGF